MARVVKTAYQQDIPIAEIRGHTHRVVLASEEVMEADHVWIEFPNGNSALVFSNGEVQLIPGGIGHDVIFTDININVDPTEEM